MSNSTDVIVQIEHTPSAQLQNNLATELKHLEEALGHCKYPSWAIKKIFKQQHLRKEKKHQPKRTNQPQRRATSSFLTHQEFVRA